MAAKKGKRKGSKKKSAKRGRNSAGNPGLTTAAAFGAKLPKKGRKGRKSSPAKSKSGYAKRAAHHATAAGKTSGKVSEGHREIAAAYRKMAK